MRISDELKRYIVDLVGATRTVAGVQLGASPRASIALMKAAQALAFFDDQEFVTPEQIMQSIQNGKIPFLPRIRGAWTFGKVKTLTITGMTAYYQMKPGDEQMDFVTPILQFSANMNNGKTNWPISFQTGIFKP